MSPYMVGEGLLVMLVLVVAGSLIQGIKTAPITGAVQIGLYLLGIGLLFALGAGASLVVGAPNARLMCKVMLVSGCSIPIQGIHFFGLPVSLGTIFAMMPFLAAMLAKFLAEVVSIAKPAGPAPTVSTPQARAELNRIRAIQAFRQNWATWLFVVVEVVINVARASVNDLGLAEFLTSMALSLSVLTLVYYLARIKARLWKSTELVWNGPKSPQNFVDELVRLLEGMGQLGQNGWRHLARRVGERSVEVKQARLRRQREAREEKQQVEEEKQRLHKWQDGTA